MKFVIPDDAPPVYRSYPREVERLRAHGEVVVYETRPASREELVERMRGATAIINVRSYNTFTEEVLAALPELKFITVLGTGIDNVDIAACNRHGVVLANTPGCSTSSVAELTIGLMLAVARSISVSDRSVRAGEWRHRHTWELKGKTLGVVGLGLIGAEVVRLAQSFGMRVVAWSFNDDPARAAQLGVELLPFDDLLRQADVVSLHLRNTPEARGMLGREQLRLMQPSAILINTARGAIVDRDALYEALRDGTLAGAGLDVFVNEPLPADDPFTSLDNVVLTPHIGAATAEAAVQLAAAPVDNIINYLAGDPSNVINPEALEHPKHRRE
jgi:D-3-phosphoglycerate dehydrogenase